jgi:hypothetical protein
MKKCIELMKKCIELEKFYRLLMNTERLLKITYCHTLIEGIFQLRRAY